MKLKLMTLLLFLVAIAAPLAAQDCQFTFPFTGNSTQAGQANLSTSTGTPCVNWRVTMSVTGTLSATVTLQTSADNVTFTTVGSTACTSTPTISPCIIEGANPIVGVSGMMYVKIYDAYLRLVVTSSSGTGTGSVRVYGAKGASASASVGGGGGGGGGGTVTSVTIAGTTNQLGVSGTCTGTTIVNCSLRFLNASVFLDSSGNFSTPGTGVFGSGGGTSGKITFSGSSTGSAAISVPSGAGTPNDILLPTSTGPSLAVLKTDGGNPQQASWLPAQGTDSKYMTAGAVSGLAAALCTDANGGATTSGCAGGGGGAAGATLFSTTASTTVTAATATTLIGAVTGSTTIPANTFTAGSVLEVMAQGFYTTPIAARTLTINLRIGGTTQITTGAVTALPSVTNGVWRLRCVVTTRTASASGTQIANCIFETAPSSLSILTPAAASMQTSSTWTVDTTGTLAIDLQAAWDATTGAPSITATNVAAWIPGAPVTSVFNQTGAVNIPVTTTDIATPAAPSAGATKWYTKAGTLCALSPASAETCTGTGGGSSTFYPGAFTNPSATAGFAPLWAVTSPPSSGWSWVNQGSGTIDSTGGYEYLDSVGAAAGTNLIARVRTAPATPYTITALLIADLYQGSAGSNTSGFGICFYDGTKFITIRLNDNNGASAYDFDKWTNSTTFSADYTVNGFNGNAMVARNAPTWVRLTDNGTNLAVFRSSDGQHWTQLGSNQSRTNFMASGPTSVGFFVYNNTARAIVSVLSWIAQ